MIYCTLFDSNYSDKGIVMIESLIKYDNNAKVYVLCMDDLCLEIMLKINISNTFPISLEEFMDNDLHTVKDNRRWGEFCWSCTAKLIKYILVNFNEPECTYVDSDLCFYSDPTVLIQEMYTSNCTVQVISHRFPNTIKGRILLKDSGSNCVQFNTFVNETRSISLLDKWIDQCIDECSIESAGDQGYTNDWDKYSFVNISSNGGAGVAPWNIGRYKQIKACNTLEVFDKYDKQKYCLIFYHFQGVKYLSRYKIQVSPIIQEWIIDGKFVLNLYCDYAREIECVKKRIQELTGFLPMTNFESKTSSNKNKSKVISQYKNRLFQMLWIKVNNKLRVLLRTKKSIIDISYMN